MGDGMLSLLQHPALLCSCQRQTKKPTTFQLPTSRGREPSTKRTKINTYYRGWALGAG